jgi:hypothetical protein
MLPITRVPETIAKGMANFRTLFCRKAGFDHVSRYVTGLIMSPNKPLQGMYALQVWDQQAPSRRAMHAGVFEAGWDAAALMQQHRAVVAGDYRGRGRTVMSLDWTLVHHERGPKIYAGQRAYDYVAHRTTLLQTVGTAVVASREVCDGLDVVVQDPLALPAAEAYLQMTAKANYEQMVDVQQRLWELLPYPLHRRTSRKRTALVIEMVRQ